MNDIAMCKGSGCPLKEKCFRFKVKSNFMLQFYFTEVPYDKNTKKCEFYYER